MSSGDSDDALIAELRSVLRNADGVPAEVTEFAKAALGWRRLDAELAELLSDSLLEVGSGGTRAPGSGSRALTFQGSGLTIDAEIQTDGDRHVLLAQLAPAPAEATVAVQGADGQVIATGDADALGRIRLAFEGGGNFRLRVLVGEATPVETSWFGL